MPEIGGDKEPDFFFEPFLNFRLEFFVVSIKMEMNISMIIFYQALLKALRHL